MSATDKCRLWAQFSAGTDFGHLFAEPKRILLWVLVVSASVGDACIAAYFERTLPHHARIQLKTDRGDEANTYVQHFRREIFSEAQFRLATVRNATRILVFDRGRIVESGAFGTLVDRGIFAALAKAQFMIGVEPK